MNVELLTEVRDFVKSHPRNVEMDYFERETASCGTVGCIAAWACILSGEEFYLSRAMGLLGLVWSQAGRLFYTLHWPPEFIARLYTATGQQYVNVVAARIDHFIATGN